VPVIDINIKRVLIHSLKLDENSTLKDLEAIALACIPQGRSRDRHNALMDYGSSVLTSKKTGIRSAKQSTFHGSRRQLRGNILKHLTKYAQLSVLDAKKLFAHENFDEILAKMVTE
jgi:A/G-specific adenine glycosylase